MRACYVFESDLYIKPTDRTLLLHQNSFHPQTCKNSIIYSQALRYRRIITDNTRLQQRLDNLLIALIHRGYKHDNIITFFNKAILYTDRMNYLIKQEMQTKQLTNQYSQLNTIVIRNTLHKYYVNTGTSLKMILHCEFYGQNLQL